MFRGGTGAMVVRLSPGRLPFQIGRRAPMTSHQGHQARREAK